MKTNDKADQIKQQIEELKKRLPAHSIPPAMIAELDDLEEKLEDEMKKQTSRDDLSTS